jgi:DNA (cytosine-5)-methyltransferase 1
MKNSAIRITVWNRTEHMTSPFRIMVWNLVPVWHSSGPEITVERLATMTKLRVLDLFSGIGGFSLGLERCGGFETVAFCEIEPFPRRVLAKHWPGVPCYDDVRTLTADRLAADGISVDVICGGFPCQDISAAGHRVGIAGERSGLWFEYARLIGELRPRYVIVENVAALLIRGLDRVLGSLAALGYDAEWHCIPASAVGAPHRRDRVWLMAYPGCQHGERRQNIQTRDGVADGQRPANWPQAIGSAECGSEDVANADGKRLQGPEPIVAATGGRRPAYPGEAIRNVRDNNSAGLAQREGKRSDPRQKLTSVVGADWWVIEPGMGRVADGVPGRVDRLRALGNAVVPQIPELIGRAIMAAEQAA